MPIVGPDAQFRPNFRLLVVLYGGIKNIFLRLSALT